MKRLLVLAVGALFVAGVANAGDFHFGANLICSDCHVMHASLQHSYGGSTTGFPVSYTPSEYLLKGGINQTCLICHDDSPGIPDVFGSDTGAMTANRSAGGLNDVGGTVPTGYEWWMGHTLGTTDTAPGDTGSFVPDATHGLVCTNCHQQHGYDNGGVDVFGTAINTLPSGSYRNLVPLNFGGITISYATGTNDLTRDVFQRSAGANHYETSNVDLNEPVTTNSGYGEWCQACHVNFHGAVGDPNSIGGTGTPPVKFVRHPNATVNIGEVGGGHSSLATFSGHAYRVRVMANAGDWGTQGTPWAAAPADLTPTCLSCHKAHGNLRAFGLIYATGANPIGENGDGTGARDLCRQCHVQGG